MENTSNTTAPKTIWDRILTVTPVILTVLATLLAGLSSSEMTRAQYYRSLAAQQQSKASDQWAFFQAKRMRGTDLQNAADLLHPVGKFGSDRFKFQVNRVTAELEQALAIHGKTRGPEPNFPKLQKLVADQAQEARLSESQLDQSLEKPEWKESFNYLSSTLLPRVDDEKTSDSEVNRALAALQESRNDSQSGPWDLPDRKLAAALEVAEGNAKRFDEACKPIDARLTQIEKAILGHTEIAEVVIAQLQDTWMEAKGMNLTKELIKPFEESSRSIERAMADLQNIFKSDRNHYHARRLRRDADYNLATANVIELQVQVSSVRSDRHRQRSEHFFYGMLVAQAGVTISTLALATRQRSVLWGLASLAGMTAVAFSAYVYLYK